MTLLDPKNVDTADLLSLLRDIRDRLNDFSDRLDSIEERAGHVEDDVTEIAGRLSAEPGQSPPAVPRMRAGGS